MKLTFCGGAKTVTGGNYLLEVGQTKVLIDCGLFQGPTELMSLNEDDFRYDPKSISHVFVTHSHQDHCGRLPKLVKDGFTGQIIAPIPSTDMMTLSLADSAKLAKKQLEGTGWPVLYTQKDVDATTLLMKGVKYGQIMRISKNLEVEILNGGHILGSAIYHFTMREGKVKKTITFLGDLGNQPSPLIPAPDVIKSTDYLVMDAVYGDRNHESMEERSEILKKFILDTVWNKSVMLIPSFAIERTQQLIYEINNLAEAHKIPSLPIFIDSPLAVKMTEIYRRYTPYFNDKIQKIIKSGDDIFRFKGLQYCEKFNDSLKIDRVKGPKIIIAGSGMSTGGRILRHEQIYLPSGKNTILFVGYQVDGTLGRQIFEGHPVVKIEGKMIKVKAHIKGIGAYSAHADQRQLLNYVDKIKSKPKTIFIVQGERESCYALKKKIDGIYKINTIVPKLDDQVEL